MFTGKDVKNRKRVSDFQVIVSKKSPVVIIAQVVINEYTNNGKSVEGGPVMLLKRNCICGSCFQTFECTGAFSPDSDRYIKGAVAWMKIVAREPGRLLMEGHTLCTSCSNPHQFLVEYDSVKDEYNEASEFSVHQPVLSQSLEPTHSGRPGASYEL